LIVQIMSPIYLGWIGIAWGGDMTYNPLGIAWMNGKSVTLSSRMAFGYFSPGAFNGSTYTPLQATGVNATHWWVTALCTGCSSWDSVLDGTTTVLDPSSPLRLAFAYSNTTVDNPANDLSTLNIHDSTGHWIHDLGSSKSKDFDAWVAKQRVAPPAAPPKPPSSSAAPAPSSSASSTVSKNTSSASSTTMKTTTSTTTTATATAPTGKTASSHGARNVKWETVPESS